MYDALRLTLKALVPGCCCLEAGLWWSVAMVNEQGRIKLCTKQRETEIHISIQLLNNYEHNTIYIQSVQFG